MTTRRQESAVVGIRFRREQLQRIAEVQRLWEARTGAWTDIGALTREAVDQYIGLGCPRRTAEEAAFPAASNVNVVVHSSVKEGGSVALMREGGHRVGRLR